MSYIKPFPLFLAFAMAALINLTALAGVRDVVSLDGQWDFATVLPDGAVGQSGKITVPGIWNNQGYGTENDRVKHDFVGVGRYQRTICVPENWDGWNVYLVLTGISRYATVWVDEKQVGTEAMGVIGSHEWNLTPFLTPGKESVLRIDVDSRQRWGTDVLLGAAQLNDYMLIVWGGIWGHAKLEARAETYMKDLFIQTNVSDSRCRAEVELVQEPLNGKSADWDAWRVEIYEYPQDANAQPVCVKTAAKADCLVEGTAKLAIDVPVLNAKLWSPETPNLYIARVAVLKGDQELDALETRFGMREIRIEGMKIFLNGRQIFLSGYGDDHIYPNEFSMPTDKQMYLRRLKIIKSFGFNHVRHHSAFLPQEYYDACDEVGMLPNGEFLLGYPAQLPGTGSLWKGGADAEKTGPEKANQFILERFGKVIREYRNHPSIFAWVLGNELNMGPPWNEMPLRTDAFKLVKSLDTTRPFMDLDGDWRRNTETGDRDTIELYSVLFDEWSNPVSNTQKFDLKELSKPAIAHEMGNYTTFSRPDQVELFEKTAFKPFWMTNGKAKLEQLGLMGEAEAWACASERLYFYLHKSGIETLRKNPRISGYHWWLFQDYWTTSNGLVDLFFRPKSIKPEEVRMVNAPVVLLQNGLNRTYRAGDSIALELLVSNFSGDSLNGTVQFTLEQGGKTESRAFPVKDAPEGEVTKFADFQWTVPEMAQPDLLTVRAKFVPQDAQAEAIANQNVWTTRLFPKDIIGTVKSENVYADAIIKARFPAWPFREIPASEQVLPADGVYLVSNLQSNVVKALENGARVIQFGSQESLPSIPIAYQQTWWKAGDSPDSNRCGTYVYDDPVTQNVAQDRWCDGAWCELLEGARKFVLDDLPNPQIVVRALPSLVLVQNSPVLFRVRVGQGVLTVSGLNHFGVQPDHPLNEWLLARMIDSAPQINNLPQWDAKLIYVDARVPEGTTLGFQKLQNASEQSTGKSHRSSSATLYICRQDKVDNEVSWQTASVKKAADKAAVSFIFAGGLGYVTQPQTEGFQLLLNGKPVIKFDLPADGTKKELEWKSEDGSAVLRFQIVTVESGGQDYLGRFTLTTSNAIDGENSLSVRSLGKDSRRWFALIPYRDLVQ